MAVTVTVDPRDLATEEMQALEWEAGNLRWLLHDEQLRLYDEYRVWQKRMRTDERGKFRRVFVVHWSRRVGKDWWCVVVKLEDCIRAAGTRHTYATAYAKDIAEIVIPVMDEVLETCPEHIRPRFHASSLGEAAGYYFPNGSRLKLAGIDMHPKALRGRASDGIVIAEAAFVEKLEDTVLSVLYPQLQGSPDATIILQSTAPEFSDGNAFDQLFIPDAKLRDAYDERTIDDNPLLTEAERQEFIAASGGPESARTRREYYNERVRDFSQAVVPEYDDKAHVAPVPQPPRGFADCYVGIDPGMRDLCAILWGYWYVEPPPDEDVLGKGWTQRLMIQRDWCQQNATTATIAKVLTDTEQELWGSVGWWDGTKIRGNPFCRVSDVELRLLGDLQADYGITVNKADKSDDKEAMLFAVRDAFARGKIQIDPTCKHLRAHLTAATWNNNRTDYLRTEAHGHYDCLDALVYLWRSVQRGRNPYPPPWYFDRSVVVRPELKRAYERGAVRTLDRVMGRNAWQSGRRT